MRRLWWAWFPVAIVTAFGCGDDGGTSDGIDDRCAADIDCSDGVFCNGAELCAPANAAADARGCIPGNSACGAGESCNEETRSCDVACDVDPDADGDGAIAVACGGNDCDDGDPERYPGNLEICDDANHDEDCDPTTFGFRDLDGDGSADLRCCNEDGDDLICGDDCDDTNRTSNPTAPEVCDGDDNDCDANIDEGVELARYTDADGDGYGDPATGSVGSCSDMEGFSPFPTDCDDTDGEVYPGALEVCDGKDTNCDGLPEDADGDGHIAMGGLCTPEEGSLPLDDCNDSDDTIYGGATETCDGIDRDCDGIVDDRADADPICDAAMIAGRGFCAAAECQLSACDAGFGDCNGLASDGCETNVSSDPTSCGACGVLCAPGAACVDGLCEERGALELAHNGTTSCVRYADDTMSCWGVDPRAYGVTPEPADIWTTTRELVPLTGVTAMGAGERSACASVGGELWCWGLDFGQLGLGTGEFSAPVTHIGPQRVGSFTDVEAVSQGLYNACILRATGELLCAGSSMFTAVGDGTQEDRDTFVSVASGIRSVDVGLNSTCAIRDADGQVLCWGSNREGGVGPSPEAELASPTEVPGVSGMVQVSAGGVLSCATNGTDATYCWGADYDGELGRDSVLGMIGDPDVVPGLNGVAVVDLSVGLRASCVVTVDGEVLCWGNNDDGQLGDGTTDSSPTPARVPALDDAVAVDVSDAGTACALRSSGDVHCWGDGRGYRLGNSALNTQLRPSPVTALSTLAEPVPGYQTLCVRHTTGTVSCAGLNDAGQLGTTTPDFVTEVPVVTDITGVRDLANGTKFHCAVTGGEVRCWGLNMSGQLGVAVNEVPNPEPVPVTGLPAEPVQLTAAGSFACALLVDGTVACWGYNADEQLGVAGIELRGSAERVAGLSDVVEVEAGVSSVCARHANGTVSCWGDGTGGRLGDGTTATRATPMLVSDLDDALDLSVGGYGACARTVGNRLRCWGRNAEGQFGDGTPQRWLTPSPGIDVRGVDAVGSGDRFRMMIVDGELRSFGRNSAGQLGLGVTTATVLEPQPVTLPADARTLGISRAGTNACVIVRSGALYCWGVNNYAVLGELAGNPERSPVLTTGY